MLPKIGQNSSFCLFLRLLAAARWLPAAEESNRSRTSFEKTYRVP